MSEQAMTAVVDETPPPDVVAQPARSRGAYKLCMECGQNVLRFEYRAGSSVCKRCEDREQTPALSVEEPGAAVGAEEDGRAREGEPAEVPEALGMVAGSQTALAWLTRTCGNPEEPLSLDQIAAKLRSVQDANAQMIGRVTRYGGLPGEIRPEDVPLETAAQALLLACDPLVQERLTAACEVLRLNLNQVILGNLAYHEQDLLDQDPSLVPQASYAVQFGTGRGRAAPAGRTGMPGGRLIDAQGQLVKDCLCCGREYHPPAQRPNPDFCDDDCGTFADQIRIWATNTVLDELRYPGSATPAPLPDPRTFWQVDRCQEPFLSHALTFREQRAQQQMANARAQQQKMRGLG